MAQRFQNTNQLFSIQRTTLQRQLYKFKAQPSTFQVEGNKYNYMGNGIYICKDMPMVVKKQDVSLLQLKKIEFTLIGKWNLHHAYLRNTWKCRMLKIIIASH